MLARAQRRRDRRSVAARRASAWAESRRRAACYPNMMGARVLIADDNADALLTLEALLDSEGFEVRGVANGVEVLPAVREFHPHAVVLDIKMPGLSGYEVARRIHGRYGEARPRLIALSGHYRQESDRLLAQGVGFDHHLAKPCDFKALLELLPAPN